MRPHRVVAGILLVLTVSAGLAASGASAAPVPAGTIEVAFDQSELSTVVGERFTLHCRIDNPGAVATDPLIAHLNVASLTSDVYVDPEDWSSSRSLVVAPLAPRNSTSSSWEIQAVSVGSFDVYVVLLPNGESSARTGSLVVSPPVHITVAGRRTLNAGGSLPVVVVVPALLGLAVVFTRLRARRAA
jgi:hypothetical protein